ncbi:MAG: methylenetetrahydrofolate reductase [Bacteroidetes bacterium]|nr:methylenetetrahydrofolate reductase [Bacteroidota bacterium]
MPLVWVAYIFPDLRGNWTRWWDKFLDWLFFLPATLFFLSLTILIALITIAISSYGIYYSQPIYKVISPALKIFDGRGRKRELSFVDKDKNYDIVLFGYNRIGFNLLKALNKAKKKFVIIDYNPDTIQDLSEKEINCIYGDANDVDFLHSLHLNKVKIVISTIPNLEANLNILNNVFDKKRVIFIPTSHHIEDTRKLYDAGADYVVTQMFYDNEFYFDYLEKCREEGINVPIIPGLKILTSKAQLHSVPKNFHVTIPDALADEVDAAVPDKVLEIGVEWATKQVEELLERNVPSVHFYIMLNSKPIKMLMDNLKLYKKVF